MRALRLLPLLLCLCATLATSAQPPEIGLQLYTFRKQLPQDVPGMLEKIRDLGIRYLEGGGTYNMAPGAYKALLDRNGLRIVSYGAGFEDLEKDPAAVAEKAKFFGAEFVMCSWVPHRGDSFTLADAQRAVSVFNKAGQVLQQQGLRFVYHLHGYEFQPYAGGTYFHLLEKELDPRFANFQMDVFWFRQSGQDPVAYLKKYPRRFLTLHLKDRKPGTPDSRNGRADVESNVVLGAGDVNIAGVMEAARAAGIKYAFIEDESSASETQVPLSLAFLRGLK